MTPSPFSNEADPIGRVRIALPDRFDFSWALRFLAARTVASLESVSDGRYTRSVRVNGQPVLLELTVPPAGHDAADSGHVLVARVQPRMTRSALSAVVTRMLDLDADLDAFDAHARRDPLLRRVVQRGSGVRLPQLLDPFEGLMRAILGQQVSVAGASTITDRLVRLLAPSRKRLGDGTFLPFPTPDAVAGVGADRLRTIGLTRVKAATIANVARRIADGALDLEALRSVPGNDAQAALESLPGIGPWTASYVRMRALGDRDAFPAADLGVIKGLAAIGVDRRSIPAVAERWRPWRGYATLHLWESLARRRFVDAANTHRDRAGLERVGTTIERRKAETAG